MADLALGACLGELAEPLGMLRSDVQHRRTVVYSSTDQTSVNTTKTTPAEIGTALPESY